MNDSAVAAAALSERTSAERARGNRMSTLDISTLFQYPRVSIRGQEHVALEQQGNAGRRLRLADAASNRFDRPCQARVSRRVGRSSSQTLSPCSPFTERSTAHRPQPCASPGAPRCPSGSDRVAGHRIQPSADAALACVEFDDGPGSCGQTPPESPNRAQVCTRPRLFGDDHHSVRTHMAGDDLDLPTAVGRVRGAGAVRGPLVVEVGKTTTGRIRPWPKAVVPGLARGTAHGRLLRVAGHGTS